MEDYKIIITHDGVREIPEGYEVLMDKDGRLIAVVLKNATADDFKETPVINWEQRRFEVAKAVISGMLTNRIFPPDKTIANDCETAIKYANEMINQLKKS